MGQRIFVISKFIKRVDDLNCFHFNGFYKGERISEILIAEGNFDKGEEYILAIDEVSREQGRLIGKLVKYRLLFT